MWGFFIKLQYLYSMERKIKLTESELINIIKKIISEQKYNIKQKSTNTNNIPKNNIKSEPKSTFNYSEYDYDNDGYDYDLRKSKPKEEYDIILISGLELYESVSEQTSRLESGGKRAFGIFYKNSRVEFPKVIKENPNAYVVFYSKGCEYAELALLKDDNGTPLVKDKSKVYIIEPYMRPSESVNAISGGVPKNNVYVGNGKSTGQGLFPDAKERPKGYSHITILSYIGTILK